MKKVSTLAAVVALVTTVAACSQPTGTLESTSEALGAAGINSIEFSGSGQWYQFGQAPAPSLPWPQFDVASYTATIDYAAPAARVQMTRSQTVEPGRQRPAPVEQRPDQYVSGGFAWNMGGPAGQPPAPQPQPAAVAERMMEIMVTPHGFLKAAAANNATSTPLGEAGGNDVSFTADGARYVGTLNAANQVEKVQAWIDNPVMGDTLVETTYSDYRDFGGVMFPARIQRTQGGYPVLDLTVSSVTANPTVSIEVPEQARNFTPPAVEVTSEELAPGVYYLRGGSHHSVAIDQADHVVVVEGPQTEERSNAVIAKVKELIPGKPLRYLINTHVHFDHSGGVRTWVAEGATIVTHEANRAFYEQAWAAPRTINPDRMAQANATATFETFSGKHTLTDGSRVIEIYPIESNGHNDAFAMVYLPAERILIEADAYTPAPAGAPAPATPNPFSVSLYENIMRLGLNVERIAALHGPGVVPLASLQTAIGQAAGN
ncbi:MAG: MBL fold metallo-hydrolase [Vicinamibacterales bacterium]